MFIVSSHELDRLITRLKRLYGSSSISDELRGWNWSNDILSPPVDDVFLSVSEVANRYCPNYRDVYLRRVVNVSAPISFKTVRGWIYHDICSGIYSLVRGKLYSHGLVRGCELFMLLMNEREKFVDSIFKHHNVDRYVKDDDYNVLKNDSNILFDYIVLNVCAKLDEILCSLSYPKVENVVGKLLPAFEEKIVDGRFIGLSKELKVDVFLDNRLVVDIKTGDVRDFHKYTLAGYALAIEADLEVPVDYGVISYLSIKDGFVKVRNDVFFIDDNIRREFIEIRDKAFDIIQMGEDPGYPVECPDYCIYYDYCSSRRLKISGEKNNS
ncbi:MAG: type I-A CRISPR-associated protein Cas4/Csa1 [Candidatus Methanomethylicia archaeon]